VLDPGKEGEALARLMVARRHITATQLDAARKDAHLRGRRLATALLAREAVDLDTLSSLLGEVHGLDPASPEDTERASKEAIACLAGRFAIRHLAVPLVLQGGTLEVVFAEVSEAAVDAVAKASSLRVRPRVAPEPLVYYGLRIHYGLSRVSRPLAALVGAIAGGTVRRRAGAIPAEPDEFVTTPMGGIIPHSPDEVTTAGVGKEPVFTPEDILMGAEHEEPFGRALLKIMGAVDFDQALAAVLAWCAGEVEAAALLTRVAGEFRLQQGVGAFAGIRDLPLGDASRSILPLALEGGDGFLGAVPDTPANALLFESLGRDPAEALLLPLSNGEAERLLYADFGGRPFDPARLERLRSLVRRVLDRGLL
jgi:hypothetical protein